LSDDKLFIVAAYSGRTVSKGNLNWVLISCNIKILEINEISLCF